MSGNIKTLGELAEVFQELKDEGVSRGSMEYVTEKVFFDQETTVSGGGIVSAMKPCWCGAEVIEIFGGHECQASNFHAPYATGERPIRMLYVAGPMTGYPGCNYHAFMAASWQLRNAGFRVWNPAERVDSHVARHYVDLLRDDLKGLLECDGVAILPDWEFSVGARNEVTVAGVLRMPVKPVADWLNHKAS